MELLIVDLISIIPVTSIIIAMVCAFLVLSALYSRYKRRLTVCGGYDEKIRKKLSDGYEKYKNSGKADGDGVCGYLQRKSRGAKILKVFFNLFVCLMVLLILAVAAVAALCRIQDELNTPISLLTVIYGFGGEVTEKILAYLQTDIGLIAIFFLLCISVTVLITANARNKTYKRRCAMIAVELDKVIGYNNLLYEESYDYNYDVEEDDSDEPLVTVSSLIGDFYDEDIDDLI